MSDTGFAKLFDPYEFLRDLSDRHRMILASGARPFAAKQGDLLAREGETANAFFLIRSGHVHLESETKGGARLLIQEVGPGETVGWSWLVPPHRWQFSCRAADAVEGLSFEAEWLRDLCERDAGLGYHLLKQLVVVITQRLAASRRHLVALHRGSSSV